MGSVQDRASDIVDRIYDAACEPGYAGLMQTLLQDFPGNSAVTVIADPVRGPTGEVFGLTPNVMQSYHDEYWKTDPWAAVVGWSWHRSMVLRGTDIVSPAQLMETRYYDEFARPIRVVRLMNAMFPVKPKTPVAIAVHRELSDPEFSDEEYARLERLLPHLQRCIQFKHRFQEELDKRCGFDGLDALASGIVICDGKGHVRFANLAAEELAHAKRGLVLGKADQVIHARLPDESVKLQSLIAQAARGGSGGALTLNGSGGQRLYALVMPLSQRFCGKRGLVLVAVRAADAQASITEQLLMQLFRLTPAEARLAAALCRGGSLSDLSNRFGVAPTTLKSQLAQVLIKTGADSQRDLLRRLGLIPQLR
jgi:DNA-binding CsgD family transcriptional regulator